MKGNSEGQKNLCFVIPRYFEGIVGGAENLMGSIARQCALRGDNVHIYTTTAKDNRTWENELSEGVSYIPVKKDSLQKVTVHRFSVDERDLDTWVPLQIKLSSSGTLKPEEQLKWMEHSVNSTPLYNHILTTADKFDALFFGPYLFGITFWGSQISPENSWLIPCLHDESYAYQDIIAHMFKSVRGCLFNARAEKELAEKLYGTINGGVVGMGFDENDEKLAPKTLFSVQDKVINFPYIMYLGRKETGKNLHLLIDLFNHYKKHSEMYSEMQEPRLKLVIAGGGDLKDALRPEAISCDDIVDLCGVSELEKRNLLKNALALVQPSTNESFSIVMMESWLEKTPCIVNENCSVTLAHSLDSGGGLFFNSASDFCGIIDYLIMNPELSDKIGHSGLNYVKNFYSWDSVIDRFYKLIGNGN